MDNLIRNKLIELNLLAMEAVKKYEFKRYLFDRLASESSKSFRAVVGPRGVGKTVLLRQLCLNSKNSFYLSADSFPRDVDLFELVKILKNYYGISDFFIDEIHFNVGYQQALKNIYDFLDVKICFTSSVALSLVESSYDLSRRVQLYKLHLFSFWEYLELSNIEVETITISMLLEGTFPAKLNLLGVHFEKYLRGAALPFFNETSDIIASQKNILKKIINQDIPQIASLTGDDIFKIEKVVKFIAKSQVDGVSYSSLSRNIGITKYKAQQYVDLLQKAFVLNVSTPHGANVSKEPKILMYLPNRLIYTDYSDSIGGIREDFATTVFNYLGLSYSYLKTVRGKKSPDFYFKYDGQRVVCEIGGPGKGYSQFKGLDNFDKKIILRHTEQFKDGDISLHLLGLVRNLD